MFVFFLKIVDLGIKRARERFWWSFFEVWRDVRT